MMRKPGSPRWWKEPRRAKRSLLPRTASAAIGANGFHELPIVPTDAEGAGNLAWAHNDPFDWLRAADG
jgi:PIN domain nuclease of toxin-antitoxin system